MHIVILAGGLGSRLWPISRKLHPKPFLKMSNKFSMLQNTFLTSLALKPKSLVNVINEACISKVQEEFTAVVGSNDNINCRYILEPMGKSTAAAIANASFLIEQEYDENELMLVLPSDHLITDHQQFSMAIEQARHLALQGKIVVFGIKPTMPKCRYGYIKFIGNEVKKFIEKPNLELAKKYCEDGNYLWNAGIFCFQVKSMLNEIKKHAPHIFNQTKLCFAASKVQSSYQLRLNAKLFEMVPANSIDYAVMEKTDKAAVVACDIGWDDIGNWNALSKLLDKDQNGNVINAQAITDKVKNCYIEGKGRLIAAIGLDNIAIIDTPDALLVANKDNSQDVKTIYDQLVKVGHQSHEVHTTVSRPWGSYTVLEEGSSFKIKRIEISPNAEMSLQSHRYRSEHFVVVSGDAKVINGEQEIILRVNQSIYIPAGSKHRVSNMSEHQNLVIVEVQVGSYLGEDDIQRFEDNYGRV